MSKWWRHFLRGPAPAAALVTAIAVFIALRFAPAEDEPTSPAFYGTTGALSVEDDESIAAELVARYPSASVRHLRVAREVRAHYHRIHDETVVILSGEGRLRLGEEWREVEPGLVVVVPRGTVHELEVTGAAVEAVSVFSPAFDGEDRLYVDE